MPIFEEREARIRFGTTGVEQLKMADDRLAGLASRTGVAAAQTSRLGAAHQISGERIGRYATIAGQLAGQMQTMGIQNELLGRTINVVSTGFMGMLGTVGAVTIGIGAAAAAVSYLVDKQREFKTATDEARKSLTDFLAAQYAASPQGQLEKKQPRSYGAAPISESEYRGLQERAVDMDVRLEKLKRERESLIQISAILQQPLADNSIYSPMVFRRTADGLAIIPESAAKARDRLIQIREEITRLTPEVEAANNALRLARTPIMQTIEVKDKRPGLEATIRPLSTEESVQQFLFQKQQERLNEGAANMPPAPPPIEDIRARYAPQLLLAGELETFTAMREAQVEREAMATERMADRGRMAYSVLTAASISLQSTASTVTMALLDREQRSRLRGVTVAKFVAAETAASAIKGISQYAAERLGQEVAELASYVAKPAYWGLIPAQTLAVGKWALVSGTSAGIAASMSAGAQKDFNRDINKKPSLPDDNTGGGGTIVGGSGSPSAQMAAASSAPQTINYNVYVNYHGSVIYGTGGTRDWFYAEIVPLIQEARGSGMLN